MGVLERVKYNKKQMEIKRFTDKLIHVHPYENTIKRCCVPYNRKKIYLDIYKLNIFIMRQR